MAPKQYLVAGSIVLDDSRNRGLSVRFENQRRAFDTLFGVELRERGINWMVSLYYQQESEDPPERFDRLFRFVPDW
jgi:hypothetical protein